MAWSGWSVTALKTTIVASPANLSMSPPSPTTAGTAAAQYRFSISTTSLAGRSSEKPVNPARSAKSTLTSRSSPTEPCPLGLALEGGRQLRGHREVEQLIHPAELAE